MFKLRRVQEHILFKGAGCATPFIASCCYGTEFSHSLLKFRNKGVRFAPISVIAPSAIADPGAAIRDLRVSGGEKIAGRCRFPETPFVVPMPGERGRLK